MKRYPWYNKKKKECEFCGWLLPDDRINLSSHAKEPFHLWQEATREVREYADKKKVSN